MGSFAVQGATVQDDEVSPTSRGQKWPKNNSVRFYRKRRDFTLQELAKALGTNHQTIGKIEKGTMKLTPEWAARIGEVLRVPGNLLAFSNDPNDSYSWAVKAVPVIGVIDSELQVNFAEHSLRRIGVPDASPGLRALDLGENSLHGFEGWTILYDQDSQEQVSPSTFERQSRNTQFLVVTANRGTWWRRIVPGARRNIYHLESRNKQTMYDVEIDYVCEVRGFEPPGQELPPFEAATT